MSRFTRRSVLKGVTAGAITLSFAGVVQAGGQTRYLVGGKGRGLRKRVERAGYTVEHVLADGRVLLVTGPDGSEDDLKDVKGVEHAAQDVLFRLEQPERTRPFDETDTTDEEFFDLQWDKQVTDVVEAHDTATGADRTIAVIDTGVDEDHPDLPNRATPGDPRTEVEFHDELTDGSIETTVRRGTGDVMLPLGEALDDHVVYDDECNFVGYDPAAFTTLDPHPVADDVHSHGTHVAGIAAGSDDGTTGIVGTAPDAEIVPLRVFNWFTEEVDTDGDDEPDTDVVNLLASFGGILLAIDYAADIDVDAMNLSIGTPPLPPQFNATGIRGVSELVIQNAVRRGSLVVVSAGNADANLQQGGFFTWPNSMAGSMSISATGPNDKRVFYSNFGTNEIDVGAPGGGYETLDKTLCAEFWDPDDGDAEVPVFGQTDNDCEAEIVDFEDCTAPEWPFPTNLVLSSVPEELGWGADYAYFAGTSMAAPQVTGTAAVLREAAPNATAKELEKAVEQGAESIEGESKAELGAGRLNVADALDASVLK